MDGNFIVELSTPLEDQVKGLQQTCIQLLERNEFVDCTLCCDDGQVQAHRILLASASTYMHNLLSTTQWPTPCSHPMLFFKTATVDDMKIALTFIYTGQAKVCKSRLAKLMNISQDLGCTSLSKAIESATKSFGTEIFRKRSNQLSRPLAKTALENKALATNGSASNFNAHRQQKLIGETLKTSPPKSSTTSESSDDQNIFILPNNDIKHEPNGLPDESDSNPMTSYQSSQSILRNTLTPPPPLLRRAMPTMLPAPGMKKQRLENLISANRSSQEDNLSLVEVIFDEDEEVVEDDDMIQNEEEMPITVIDLKNLAESESVDSTLVDDMLGMQSATEKAEVLPANCPWCQQVFTSLTLLQRHIKTHVGNYKPYGCDYCPATFARSAHLKRHIRTHTGEKPFICAICEKAFSRQDKLKTHLERHMQVSNNTNNGTNQQSILKAGLQKIQQRLTTNQRVQVNNATDYGLETGHFLCNNNNGSNNWSLPPTASRNLLENQLTVTTSSISPSTTITPISGVPLDSPQNYGFMNQGQMEINLTAAK